MSRRGLALIPLALPLLAIIEIATFVAVAHAIGAGWAFLILAAASLAGMLLLRREGMRGWRRFRAAADEGRPPGPEVSHSLVGLFGALLLALPGFFTGVLGLLLLLPPARLLIRRQVERSTERRVGGAVADDLFGPRKVKVRPGDPVVDVPAQPQAPAAAIEGEVIEGEVIR